MPLIILRYYPTFPPIKSGLFIIMLFILISVRGLVANIIRVNAAIVIAKIGAVHFFKKAGF
jgi:hypothetical protein